MGNNSAAANPCRLRLGRRRVRQRDREVHVLKDDIGHLGRYERWESRQEPRANTITGTEVRSSNGERGKICASGGSIQLERDETACDGCRYAWNLIS